MPRAADVRFGRADVADGEPQHKSVVQFRVRDKDLARSIDGLHDRFVKGVRARSPFGLRFAFALFRKRAKTDRAEGNGREQLPCRRRGFDPRGKTAREATVLAYARAEPLLAEVAYDHPELERAKAPAQLNAVIHAVTHSLVVGRPQILRHEREGAAHCFEASRVED